MKPPSPSKPALTITRVTLPRYELEYRRPRLALDHAKQLAKTRILDLEYVFSEPVGQEIVLDLGIREDAHKATLLFRLIQKLEDRTVVEWWARRKTDPDMLELWIEGLERLAETGSATGEHEVAPAELQQLYELCRRALSGNPFVALGIHWTAGDAAVQQGYAESVRNVRRYASFPGIGPRAKKLLGRAEESLAEARRSLSDARERQFLRKRFVQDHQLAQARELATSKLAIARLRNDRDEIKRCRDEIRELGS